eukprot:1161354-Pelagomonas_calceolata.AAC.7
MSGALPSSLLGTCGVNARIAAATSAWGQGAPAAQSSCGHCKECRVGDTEIKNVQKSSNIIGVQTCKDCQRRQAFKIAAMGYLQGN